MAADPHLHVSIEPLHQGTGIKATDTSHGSLVRWIDRRVPGSKNSHGKYVCNRLIRCQTSQVPLDGRDGRIEVFKRPGQLQPSVFGASLAAVNFGEMPFKVVYLATQFKSDLHSTTRLPRSLAASNSRSRTSAKRRPIRMNAGGNRSRRRLSGIDRVIRFVVSAE